MKIPLVAIIGLPNSGKSTFFNKVLERRTALTHDIAGTTRDRAYGLATWGGMGFYLVDTAGIIPRTDSELEKNIQKQTEIAQEEADVIIIMVDGKTPPASSDRDVAKRLHKTKKPVILAVNKIDVHNAKTSANGESYRKLGLGTPYLMSSVNGSGMGDVLDQVVTELKRTFKAEAYEHKGLRVAFLGKPNVGKSSLVNALLKEDRMLVDAKAGTTRSSVEIPFQRDGKDYVLIDTAGIKKKWKQEVDIEAAAMMQSLRIISQVDVGLFVLDATERITVQDQVISQNIIEENKPVVVLLNKVDMLDADAREKLMNILPDHFPQIWWAPVVFTSGKRGTNLDKVLELAQQSHDSANRMLENTQLDAFLDGILKDHMPGKIEDQRAPKIYNIKQLAVRPPYFKITVNFPNAFAQAWKKLLEKQFRLKFGFEGSPVIITYAKKE